MDWDENNTNEEGEYYTNEENTSTSLCILSFHPFPHFTAYIKFSIQRHSLEICAQVLKHDAWFAQSYYAQHLFDAWSYETGPIYFVVHDVYIYDCYTLGTVRTSREFPTQNLMVKIYIFETQTLYGKNKNKKRENGVHLFCILRYMYPSGTIICYLGYEVLVRLIILFIMVKGH